jgi:2-polyprenyl-6-methoxyphenol hydroxylase-like FAD-dependent oxidoreductase
VTERRLDTGCCVVGGGPAGLMLGLLLARAGVDVTVLEKHADFLRDFRGDTIHPSTIDLMDELGLSKRFLALPQNDVATLDFVVSGNRIRPIDFSRLRGGARFLALMPQWDFLNFLAAEAARYPNFRLELRAEVTGLVRSGPRVVGVIATTPDGPLEVRAPLTVAADGRSSVARAASGLVARDFGVPIDVLWFRLPKVGKAPPDTLAYLDGNSMVLTIPRGEYYQSGMVIAKGGFDEIRAGGIDAFRARLVSAAAFLEPVVGTLTSWDQVSLLSVQVDRLDRWYLPGFLCIGDAAHAMSPAFGVGVNYAIQDAVATARYLAGPLRTGSVSQHDLARVQRRRLPPVRAMQPLQLAVHRLIGHRGVSLPNPLPAPARGLLRIALPVVQWIAARLVGRGFRPEHIGRG